MIGTSAPSSFGDSSALLMICVDKSSEEAMAPSTGGDGLGLQVRTG